MKKFLSILLCALMLSALSLPAFADDPDDFDYDIETEDAFADEPDVDFDDDFDIEDIFSDMPTDIPDERLLPRLVDDADLLTDAEEASLIATLDEISERQKFDVAVVTVDSLYGYTPMQFADDYYDYNGFGFGEDRDGAVLVLSMEDRDYYISTCGFGIKAISDSVRENMEEEFVPYLSNSDYYNGFDTFANLCDKYVTDARTFPFLSRILIALAIGLIIALIVVKSMKKQLTSVTMQDSATNYTKPGSMNIIESRDMFLYSNISKNPKVQSSGGGTHSSSSGTSHGGGGGKF